MTILITGAAGFIGAHLARNLLEAGHRVVGIDHCQAFPAFSEHRLSWLAGLPGFVFIRQSLTDQTALEEIIRVYPDIRTVIHLAGYGGVRRSREDPALYVENNIRAHIILLEACRKLPKLNHLLYASSSAVYGDSQYLPFRERDPLGVAASFYAVSKRSNELAAQTYSHLYGFSQTGLRFFTVYGPWGRPDMACYKFACAIRDKKPLTLWNGLLLRDFTYIDDIIAAVMRLIPLPPEKGKNQIFNIGYGQPRPVSLLVDLLGQKIGQEAMIRSSSRPEEDLSRTWADTSALAAYCGWKAMTPLEEGIEKFVDWFRFFSI